AFVLLDVCAHGVGSALLSVSALNPLRSQALPDIDFRDPAAVLGGMNEAYQSSQHGGLYFTLWYGVYNMPARTLTHASAGHPPSLLMAENAICRVLSGNLMIGAFPRVPFRSAQVDIPPGARLYMFSDGVYQCTLPDDSMWSLDDLSAHRRDTPHDGGAEIDHLYTRLQQLHGHDVLEDDFSMVRVDFA